MSDRWWVILLIVIAAASLGWAAAHALVERLLGQRRHISRRLTVEPRSQAIERSAVLQEGSRSALMDRLLRVGYVRRLQTRLTTAMPEASLLGFLVLSLYLPIVAYMLVSAVFGSAMAGLVAAAVGFYLPQAYLGMRLSARRAAMSRQLPEALDYLSRVLRAGHSFSNAMQLVGQELPDPLGGEFRRAWGLHSLGKPMDDCLRDMGHRVDSSEFSFFVSAVLIQKQTGGDLTEVLSKIAGTIRQRVALQAHARAKTAEGRLSGYVLCAFPAAMFLLSYIFNPEYAGLLIETPLGVTLLTLAGGFALLGLYFIRRLTVLKV